MAAVETVVAGKLSFGVKLLYGFGSLAYGAKIQMLALLLLFYNQVIGVPAHLVSLAIAISLFADAFWDPLIGQVSDKTRTKWGRRHPYMYAAAVPVAIGFVLLWNPPGDWSDMALFFYLLVCVMTVRLATSFYEVPSTALGPELAPDYHERTVLMGYRYLFLAGGGAVANLLAYGIFLRATAEHPTGQLNPDGYGPLAMAIALLIVGSILISTWGTHHKIKDLHRPPEARVSLADTIKEVMATLKNWNLGMAVAAGTSYGMVQGLSTGLAIYFSTFFWGLSARQLFVVAMATLAAAPVATFLVAPPVSRALGKKRGCMVLFMVAVTLQNIPILLRLIGVFPENGSPWLLPLLVLDRFVFTTLAIAGFIIVTSMLADIVEESQIKTGRRSEGLILSADSIVQKVASSLATILPGLFLAFIEFPEKANPATIDPDILWRLGWYYLPTILILSFASISIWSFYRIDKNAHDENLANLRRVATVAEQSEAAPTT